MTTTLIVIMVALPGVGIVTTLLAGWQLKVFAVRHAVLASQDDIEDLKKLAAGQMYGALVQAVILISPWLVFFYGLWTRDLKVLHCLWIGAASVPVAIVAWLMKSLEKKVHSLPADDPKLAAERDRIVDTWVHKALPDW